MPVGRAAPNQLSVCAPGGGGGGGERGDGAGDSHAQEARGDGCQVGRVVTTMKIGQTRKVGRLPRLPRTRRHPRGSDSAGLGVLGGWVCASEDDARGGLSARWLRPMPGPCTLHPTPPHKTSGPAPPRAAALELGTCKFFFARASALTMLAGQHCRGLEDATSPSPAPSPAPAPAAPKKRAGLKNLLRSRGARNRCSPEAGLCTLSLLGVESLATGDCVFAACSLAAPRRDPCPIRRATFSGWLGLEV